MSSLQRSLSYFFITTIALLGFFFLAGSVSAATVTVNSTNADADAMDGQCNLEEAINAINGQSNSGDCFANLDNPYGTDDTILFDINGGGPVTITGSTSPLTISNPVIIDGLWQDDLATCGTEDHMGDRALYVTLDGFVLQVYSDDVTIYGLVFAHDVDALVFGEGQGHYVFCNNFGFDGSGQDTLGPTGAKLRINAVDGIEVGYNNDRKLGNMFAGSVDDNATQTLAVTNSSNVTIHGNRFGVGGGENPDVLGAVGSHIDFDIYDSEPWFIARNGENILIQNNYLYDSGGGASAITIQIGEEEWFGIDDVQILDNTISFSEIILDTNGIEVQNNITNLVIDGNIIQNFSASGIDLQEIQGATITNNTIESSSEDGIGITLGSVRDVIVGTPSNGNTIHTFSPAIELTPAGGNMVTENVIIQGNTFTSIDGPAVQAGLSVENVLIGGTQAGEGNTLSGLVGVLLFYSSAAEEYDPMLTVDNIAILGNTIDAQGGIAWLIDTDGDFNPEYTEGLISNDTLDTLSVLGPNRLIHSPEIISTTDNGDSTFTVEYEIDVAAGEYRIEWYRDVNASDVNAGIGNEFLDSVNITHTGNGPETFTITLPVALDDILAVTLTEIIAPGTNDWNFGATSQFSPQFVVALVEEITQQPSTPRRSSGGSVQQQVSNLQNQGKKEQAQELKDQFPQLFNETTPTIQSLLIKIQQLQTLLQQLQNQSTSPSSLVCTPPLRIGSTGTMVQLLQTKLNITPADGIFGPQTAQSVRTFQQSKNLVIDGVAGIQTCNAF